MPNYTFTTNIPLGTDNPSDSAGQFNTNFTSTASIVNVDLFGFNNNSGGYHQKSTYVDQSTDPGSASGQVVEYAKSVVYPNSFGTFSELFIQRDGVSTPIQMTSSLASFGASSAFGQSFLPGAFQLRWGTETLPSGSGTNILYTAVSRGLLAFPNNTLVVFVTPQGSDATQTSVDASLSRTGFTIYSTKNALSVCWLAIGY